MLSSDMVGGEYLYLIGGCRVMNQGQLLRHLMTPHGKRDCCPGNPPDKSDDQNQCGHCGLPATGWAWINDVRYCHGDEMEFPTCYEWACRYTG